MQNKKRVLFIVFVVSISIICIMKLYFSVSDDKIERYLYSLDRNITEKQLEKKGFINTTEVNDRKNSKISKFLYNIQSGKKSIVKVYFYKDDILYTKIFYYDTGINEIRSWQYAVKEQFAIDPDKRFSKKYEEVCEDNILSIKLIQIQNRTISEKQELHEEILYSYKAN